MKDFSEQPTIATQGRPVQQGGHSPAKIEQNTYSPSIPVRNVPGKKPPVQSPPVQSPPVQSVPIQSVPIQSVPIQSVPIQSVPIQSVPIQSVPAPQPETTPEAPTILYVPAKKQGAIPGQPPASSPPASSVPEAPAVPPSGFNAPYPPLLSPASPQYQREAPPSSYYPPPGSQPAPVIVYPASDLVLTRNERPGNGLAIAGLACGILSIILPIIAIPVFGSGYIIDYTNSYPQNEPPLLTFGLSFLLVLLGVLAIILSVVGGFKNQQAGVRRGGISIAGMICGIVGIVISIICLACFGCCVCTTYEFTKGYHEFWDNYQHY